MKSWTHLFEGIKLGANVAGHFGSRICRFNMHEVFCFFGWREKSWNAGWKEWDLLKNMLFSQDTVIFGRISCFYLKYCTWVIWCLFFEVSLIISYPKDQPRSHKSLVGTGDPIQNPAKTRVIHSCTPIFLEEAMILRVYNIAIYWTIYIVVRSPKVTTPWKSKLTIEIIGGTSPSRLSFRVRECFNHPKLGVAIIFIDIPSNPVFYIGILKWCLWNNAQIAG